MGADKSLVLPGRKQANISVRMTWIFFGVLPCRKKKLMTARVSILLKSRASLTCFRVCFFPGRAKDLSAPLYVHQILPFPSNCVEDDFWSKSRLMWQLVRLKDRRSNMLEYFFYRLFFSAGNSMWHFPYYLRLTTPVLQLLNDIDSLQKTYIYDVTVYREVFLKFQGHEQIFFD